jgi:hypothetical protein
MRRECFTVVDLVFDGYANPIPMTEEANCIALPLLQGSRSTGLKHPHLEQWQSVCATGGSILLGYVRVSKGEKQETRMQETAFRAASLTRAPR